MNEIKFYQGKTPLHENKDFSSIHSDEGNDEGISGEEKLIQAIKNKILELFNMKNVNFLLGSGTSAGPIPTMKKLYSISKKKIDLNEELKKEFEFIVRGIKEKFKENNNYNEGDNSECNLEEILGVLYSHRVYQSTIINHPALKKRCEKLIKIIEGTIFKEINIDIKSQHDSLELYKTFYSKIALRNKDLSRINIFTTNNDLFSEYALDSLNINYINGFGGGINKYFNPAFFKYTYSKRMDTSIDKFEPVENMIYLYKIHGSINWINDQEKDNIYFPIKEVSKPDINKDVALIYPTPTKQNKSLGSPYVELFREFQTKLLEPNNVLFVIGYSFSDEHVNNIINQALATNSSLTLVILNNIEGKYIDEINDNRIFKIYGSIKSTETDKSAETNKNIHFFEYIVNELLPNLDTNKQEKDIVEKFINALNSRS